MFSQGDFEEGIVSGLLEYNPDVSTNFQPRLILNDNQRGRKTLEFVLDNLSECSSFRFAIAFVTRSGVACLHQVLKDFVERGGTGEILVSTYLSFSEPNAIEALTRFNGITVSFVNEPNFHGKTYLFEFEKYSRLLVGSSNLTQNALGKNTEVNLTVTIKKKSSLYIETRDQMDYWSGKSALVDDANLAAYTEEWSAAKGRHKQETIATAPVEIMSEIGVLLATDDASSLLRPNSMQNQALKRLEEVRNNGAARSLVVSATGTGKTILSAFDVLQFGAKRLLFVVHRLNIAGKAMREFRRVFGDTKSMGIYSAGQLNSSAEFIFSTVQTINADHHLNKFAKDAFDYIIIDETHRAGAKTYNKIIEYFEPKFLLGMTATPERTDGFDIFALFNHSIAYEIRLQAALEADLLAPFHYFGVADISIDGAPLNDKADFNALTSSSRVNHIIDTLDEYGTDIDRPRGLIFCSRVDEARQLSEEFNQRGFKTRSITGSDTENFREESISQLEASDGNRLDYLFTVDVFNEGVDIPQINQVVMLRPTSSAIIFVQQLGRGLRKAPGKDYVTVIDFIGNYQNNYMIPLALFGDSSYNKDKLRRLLSAGSSLIPGASSISFEKIARERVFASIDSAKLNTKKALIDDFNLLKFRLGRSPMMMDFIENNSRDPYQYVDYSGSLLEFTAGQETSLAVAQRNLKLLAYLGKHVCDGIRLEEAVILKLVLEREVVTLEDIAIEVRTTSGFQTDGKVLASAVHNINLHFVTERTGSQTLRVSEASKFKVLCSDMNEGLVQLGDTLADVVKCRLSKMYLLDLCNAAIAKFMTEFDLENYVRGFKRGGKYTRKDVFRILNWDKLPNAQNVGGYIVSPDRTNCPIFVTYHKEEGISETTKYEDRFLNPGHVIYMSKSRRTRNSPDVRAISKHKVNEMRIPFFAKKNNDEGLDFYYLGDLTALTEKFEDTTMPGDGGTPVSVVKMEFLIDRPVDYRLYKYFINE